jgi:hypothetical protein
MLSRAVHSLSGGSVSVPGLGIDAPIRTTSLRCGSRRRGRVGPRRCDEQVGLRGLREGAAHHLALFDEAAPDDKNIPVRIEQPIGKQRS